ncbi:MAG: GGDEF domain-containing protein, partial [Planctomycetota bacterium]
FAQLDRADRMRIDGSESLEGNFDYYIPMIYRGRAIGCVAVGGIGRAVNKARAAGMAVANLGSLVLTSILRERQVRTLSEQDPLTQLSNRRHCYELLGERLEHRRTSPFALFLFDIDNFKQVNDEHGHAVGDEVLRKLAAIARQLVHPEEDEFAARIGGEEFLCLLGCEDVAALAARLEDFRLAVSHIDVEADSDKASVIVRVSGGVAFYPAEEADADALIRLADDRLYAAKKSGRNRIFLESGPAKVRR